MSNAAAPTAPPSVIHSYGVNGGAHVCCRPTALDSRAMTQRLSMPPRTVQTTPVALVEPFVFSGCIGFLWRTEDVRCSPKVNQH